MILFQISFAQPWAFALLIVPVIMGLYEYFFSKKHQTFMLFSTTQVAQKTLKTRLRTLLPILPILSSIFLILAIARPQSDMSKENSYTNGIDIVMALDVSTSMLEQDFKPNRLNAAKNVASEFISKRPNDRIGLVIFAGESFTQCPPTIDHNILQKQLKEVREGILEDGTAIGMGLATSVRALKNSQAKSKVIILLTDGVNTAGTIDPMTSIEIAKALKTKVYCIGVGTPRGNILGIDEPLMRKIASTTGGLYFRAGNNQRLSEIYEEINQLETVEIEVNSLHRKTEEFLPWAIIAGIFMLLYFVLRYSWLRSVH
jgi:Ca-activated chloride channel family protein